MPKISVQVFAIASHQHKIVPFQFQLKHYYILIITNTQIQTSQRLIPPFGMYPVQKENQAPCQEQDHKSYSQSLQCLRKQPRPANISIQ